MSGPRKDKRTDALREAAAVGDLEMVNKLVGAGVEVNNANSVNGW